MVTTIYAHLNIIRLASTIFSVILLEYSEMQKYYLF
jgi:hypothetical protein